ncbi:MAG: protein kinase domain-containing protein [Pyrinomonadaceae bacterium]
MNKELEANTNLSHYRIVSKIGAGGMGEVYLAQDTKLERQVALKVLLAEVADDEDRVRRFEQEAKAVSALNHPNILTVYEIGSFENLRFIATELIKGETLRDRLKGEPLTLRETLDAALQVAAALNAAHNAGIVHRDIKPENVMLRDDGLVKVLDFGLAKLTEKKTAAVDSEGETRAQVKTSPGLVMGTVAYMSPEQSRGKAVDARSDIWSLGVVIYEMLTKRTPFAGETANDSIAAILAREPAPLDGNMPPELQRIIRKSLQKKADERYQTVKDFLLDVKNLKRELEFAEELERSQIPTSAKSSNVSPNQSSENATAIHPAAISTQNNFSNQSSSAEYVAREIKKHKLGFAAGLLVLLAATGLGYWLFSNRIANTKQIESIAVMPFVNESGNADIEYLSDGMTETLISSLSQLPNLNVKARSSVFRYKGKEIDAQTIGKELNVQAILNGRVVQRGQDLILYLELVDATTGNRIWGDQYNRKTADLVSLQSEIARDVSQKLKTKISGADEQKLAKNYTENAEAYQLYLRGRFYWNKSTAENHRKAIEYFNQAIAIDPNYALAYAGIADAYPLLSFTKPQEVMSKAREAALKALSLDNNLAEAHVALGRVLLDYDYDFAAAERENKTAIELNPNYALAHSSYGSLLTRLGRHEEAFAKYRRALEIEPLSLRINRSYGEGLIYARRYDEAIAQLKKTLELDATFVAAHVSLGFAYQMKGKYAESLEERAKGRELQGNPQHAEQARESFAKGGWEGFLRDATGDHNRAAYLTATLYAALGEKDEAFAELNKSYENREYFMTLLKVDPRLDPLRDDPRFQELLRKVGFPP